MQFGTMLKDWRTQRRLSQMDLALDAGVSPRHISFLETGRSGPSRGMVLNLAEILETPREDRNAMLTAAGFAPVYSNMPMDDTAMSDIRRAVDWTIDRHAPYPAVAIDRLWTLVAMNEPAKMLFGAAGLSVGSSMLDTLVNPATAREVVENWGEVGHHAMRRLRTESRASGGIEELDRAADALAQDDEVAAYQPPAILPPVIPTIYRAGSIRLALFSTLAQFGTAEDIALADLRIELMFPADEDTRTALEAMFGNK